MFLVVTLSWQYQHLNSEAETSPFTTRHLNSISKRVRWQTAQMQAPSETRRKYCADCGKEIKPDQGIELNYRHIVYSEDCKKEFTQGKIL